MSRVLLRLHAAWSVQPAWMRVAVIALALLGLYLLLASSSTLWDRDEPRFARAAVEMLRSGDYLVITFNDDLRAVKPPMVYWLMTLGLRMLGETELAVRMWSGIGVAAAAVGVYGCARRMIGPAGGEWAMVIFGTSLMPLWLATAATADGVLIIWMVLAQWLFTEMVYRGWRRRDMIALAAALGLTALAKGPMAVLPVLSIALSVLLIRRTGPNPPRFGLGFWIWFGAATAAGVAIFLAWAVPANAATAGELAKEGLFGTGFLTRMVKPMEGHGGEGVIGYLLALPAYVPLLFFVTFPWCMLLLGTFSALVRGRLAGPRERALIWAWTLPTFVIFTLVATKLPHYMLGLMPMLAIAMAAMLTRLSTTDQMAPANEQPVRDQREPHLHPNDRAWARRGGNVVLVLWGGIGVALIVAPWVLRVGGKHDIGLIVAGAIIGVVSLAAAGVSARLQRRDRFHDAARMALAGHAAVAMLVALVLMPQLEQTVKISPELAAAVREHVPEEAPVWMLGYEEPSLVFYLDRPVGQEVRAMRGGRDRLMEFARAQGPAALVISRDAWERLGEQGPLPENLERVAVEHTLNYTARARKTEVWVLIRS